MGIWNLSLSDVEIDFCSTTCSLIYRRERVLIKSNSIFQRKSATIFLNGYHVFVISDTIQTETIEKVVLMFSNFYAVTIDDPSFMKCRKVKLIA